MINKIKKGDIIHGKIGEFRVQVVTKKAILIDLESKLKQVETTILPFFIPQSFLFKITEEQEGKNVRYFIHNIPEWYWRKRLNQDNL